MFQPRFDRLENVLRRIQQLPARVEPHASQMGLLQEEHRLLEGQHIISNRRVVPQLDIHLIQDWVDRRKLMHQNKIWSLLLDKREAVEELRIFSMDQRMDLQHQIPVRG